MGRGITSFVVGLVLLAGCSSGTSASRPTTPATTSGKTTVAKNMPRVTVVTQNMLHGNACSPASNRCDLPGRVALFTRQLAANHCPPIVATEETNDTTIAALRVSLPTVCGGRYRIVWDNDPAQDREAVLTSETVLGSERIRLGGPVRTALWVRVSAPVGVVDLVVTHLATGSDNGPCQKETCPAPCRLTDLLSTCQARQAADFLETKLTAASVGLLVGDMNAVPTDPAITGLLAGGDVDTFRAAGNPECAPSTGVDCTSGRIDTDFTDLKNKNGARQQKERIDDVFLTTTRTCEVVQPTGVFQPNGGPTDADGLVFPSDHSGVEATLACVTDAADRAAAKPGASVNSTTTTAVAAAVPAATRAAVITAYANVFSAKYPDPNQRLRSLENAAAFRASFVERMNSLGAIVNQTSVRIDSMTADGPNAVNLTYTILLKGAPVLDDLPGRAVRQQGTWLVAAKTYCSVATLGTKTVPAACQ